MPDLAAAPALPAAVIAVHEGREPPDLVVRAEERPLALVQPFRGRRAEAAERLRALGGPDAPDAPRGVDGARFALLWAGPEGWLALGGEPARVAEALEGVAAVADQSDARFLLRLSGPAARATLARAVDLDLHPRAFSPGAVALTRLRQMAVTLWLRGPEPEFALIAPRPTAPDLWRWLARAGAAAGIGAAR